MVGFQRRAIRPKVGFAPRSGRPRLPPNELVVRRGLLVRNARDRAFRGTCGRAGHRLDHFARAFGIGDPLRIEVVGTGRQPFRAFARIDHAGITAMDQLVEVVLRLAVAAEIADQILRQLRPVPQWLEQAQKGNAGSKAAGMAAFPGNEQLRLQYMGKLGPNEFLLRLAKDSGADAPAEFSSELGLTAREGEVLSWLSKGKTNRDIAQILGLSPRTVDKHLEQIYSKLGVENRTAAAAIAVKTKHLKQ